MTKLLITILATTFIGGCVFPHLIACERSGNGMRRK